MKISIPKSPPAARPAEPPKNGNSGIVPPKGTNTGIVPPKGTNTGIVPPKGTNTGIVPPKGTNTGIVPPGDGFQPATPPAGKGGTSAATGASATSLTGTSSTSTYALAPNLEQFRELFDKEGERISKLPSEQQAGEIELTSSRLYEQLKEYGSLEDVTSGVKESVAFYSRRSGGDDPMTYSLAADVAADTSFRSGGSGQEPSVDFGASFNGSVGSRDTGSLPRSTREEPAEREAHQRFRRMRRHNF
jgi:hypothetical protein